MPKLHEKVINNTMHETKINSLEIPKIPKETKINTLEIPKIPRNVYGLIRCTLPNVEMLSNDMTLCHI